MHCIMLNILQTVLVFDYDDVSICVYVLYYIGSLLLLITLTSTTSCSVNVTYLRGVPRLSNTSYWDYYYFCNTVGTTLIWEVNGTGLNGFQGVGVVGQVESGTLPSYTYIATLLSSKPTTDSLFIFDSILIVSVPGMSSLDVVCSNGPSCNRTSNMENGKGVESSTFTSSIFEEYLLTDDIVGDQSIHTSIFICGVWNVFMYWRAGTHNSELEFSEHDNVGQERRNVEPGSTIVKEQAIVIAHEPYRIVSVFFATATSDVTVTCGYSSQNEVSLTSRYDSSTSVPTVQTDPEIVSRTTLGKWIVYTFMSDISV